MYAGIVTIIEAIGSLPNTFWGIVVLFASMRIAVHYNMAIGYYFAGVGSTLLGIKQAEALLKTNTNIIDSTIKEDKNASDPTNKT